MPAPTAGHEGHASTEPEAHHAEHATGVAGTEEQTLCPVMGNEINREVFTDYLGVRVYFCCEPCIDKFLADPQTYIPKLPEAIQQKLRGADRPAEGHAHD